MEKFITILTVILLAVPCSGETITVDDNGPADFRSIQDAINSSRHGDVIVVKPGTYAEQVIFNGRAVTVRSEDPDDGAVVQTTVITHDSDFTVLFRSGEGHKSMLKGFTITGYGILCSGTSPTISKNTIRDCRGAGIQGENDATPTVVGNTIVSCERQGIDSCGGSIVSNTISQNVAGLRNCDGPILDNVILDNGDTGGLSSCHGEIAGNVIVGNYVRAGSGGGLYGCEGTIHHNVIAGNRADFDGGGLHECTTSVYSNTIAGNRAARFGGGISRCSGTVRNNIIAFNEAETGGGIYGPCNNMYNAYYANVMLDLAGGATWGVGEISVDPQFAVDGYWDDRGTDDPSDDSWVNGDYHLRSQRGRWDPGSRRWVTDTTSSPCIDAGNTGSDWSAELWPHGQRINMGAYGGTPQASFSLVELGHRADLDHDGDVGPLDLKLLGRAWGLQQDLLAEDLDRNGRVDFNDFAILGASWYIVEVVIPPPQPDPMSWETKPYLIPPNSAAMVAATATSPDGKGVEYRFAERYGKKSERDEALDSGWVRFATGDDPYWEFHDLSCGTTYWFWVKARNQSNQVETQWSQPWFVDTPPCDFEAPTPNPLTWATEPHCLAPGVVRMVATTATDESGVEYQFQYERALQDPPGLVSSPWQDSPIYEVTLPKGHYIFRARTRDKSRNQNTGAFSLDVNVDLQPPTPNPMQWESPPREEHLEPGSFGYGATMTAVEATDDSAGVEYYFECTSNPGFSSGWQTSPDYSVVMGRQGLHYRFRVKARDTSSCHNETGYSSTVEAN